MKKDNLVAHPGSRLKEILEQRGLKQKDFANEIQVASSQFNEIIKGKRSITADFAILLEAALGIRAIEWLTMQGEYDLDKSKEKLSKINSITTQLEKWNKVRELIPYSFFRKQGFITGDILSDKEKIKEIYNISSLEELSVKLAAAENSRKFRKTEVRATNKVNLLGWLSLVDYEARQIKDINNYDPSIKDSLISLLRKVFLANKNVKDNCETILKDAGIKLIYQDKPEQAPVDGVAFWQGNNPVIGLSGRYNRLDNFAFTLFHELGHIFYHEQQIKENNLSIDRLDNLDDYSFITKDKEEKEANTFASDNLIPKKEWDRFNFENYIFSDNAIQNFADSIGIHPAIVIGRLRFENPILYRRRFKVSNEIL